MDPLAKDNQLKLKTVQLHRNAAAITFKISMLEILDNQMFAIRGLIGKALTNYTASVRI